MSPRNNKTYFYCISIALSLFLGITACKKKDKDSSANTTTSTTARILSTVNGSFLIDKTVTADLDTISSARGDIYAYFSDTVHALDNFNVLNCSDIGRITVNNITLQRSLYQFNNSYLYKDTTATVFNSPIHVSATGGSGIAAFNYTNTTNYPVYTGFHALPDTVYINQGVTLHINNFFNADKVTVHIASSNSNQTGTVIVYPGNSNILFAPQDLKYLDTTSFGYNIIVVSLYKDSFTTINGRSYLFRMRYNMNYFMTVKP